MLFPSCPNDCLVSTFCRLLKPDMCMMAANFRGKVDGCDDQLVGDYEDLIEHFPRDCASPSRLRRSVTGPTYRRTGVPATAKLSGWQHVAGATYGAATNWSTVAGHLIQSLGYRFPYQVLLQ